MKQSFKECFMMRLRNYKNEKNLFFKEPNHDKIKEEIGYLTNKDDIHQYPFTFVEIIDENGVEISYDDKNRLNHIYAAINNLKKDKIIEHTYPEILPEKYPYYSLNYSNIYGILCIILILLLEKNKIKVMLLFLICFFLI